MMGTFVEIITYMLVAAGVSFAIIVLRRVTKS